MNNKRFIKPAILVFASLLAMTSGAVRADHEVDIVTPLVTIFAAGALLHYARPSQHYYHYYSYRRQSHYQGGHSRHGYGSHGYRSHGYSNHGYRSHAYKGHGYSKHGYSKRQSSHGHYARPQRHSSSAGGYHVPRRKH